MGRMQPADKSSSALLYQDKQKNESNTFRMVELSNKFQNIKKIMSKCLEHLSNSSLHNNKLRKCTSKLKLKNYKIRVFCKVVNICTKKIK